MKNIFAFLLCLFVFNADAQTADPELVKRLDEYGRLNRALKFAGLMEYIHPVLFKLAPKEDMIKLFEVEFNREDLSISIDSISVLTISPIYRHTSGSYHKVDYFMIMTMEFKDKSLVEDSSFAAFMTKNMESSFPLKKVEFNPANVSYKISGMDILLAIKDNQTTPWLFLGYEPSKAEILASLLPAEVLEHFQLKE